MLLSSARKEYVEQQHLTALAVAQAQRLASRGSIVVAASIQQYQAAAVALSLQSLAGLLSEQGISPASNATVAPYSLLTDRQSTIGMLDNTATPDAFAQLVQAMVQDASRTARAVDISTRQAVTGYVRSLTPPSCGRCAVLAGRFYRYSQGFQRHPRCDCLMTPSTESVSKDLITDPMQMFREGKITDLSTADVKAVDMGADLSHVVNVKRKAAGLSVGSSVMIRAGRMTPAYCLSVAGGDRAKALELLKRFGYIT